MPPEPKMEGDEFEPVDSEFLPSDDPEAALPDGEVAEEVTPEAQTAEESSPEEPTEEVVADSTTPSQDPIDPDVIVQRVADQMTANLERGLQQVYQKLRQSSRDTIRAEVSKNVKGQIAVLDGLHQKGRLGDDEYAAEKAALLSGVDDQVDAILAKGAKPEDDQIRLPAAQTNATVHPMQEAFQDACLSIYEANGLTPADPETAKLAGIRFPATMNFKQALAAYQKAVQTAVNEKNVRLTKKKPTRVDMGGGKSSATPEALLRELNTLLRKSGGTLEERTQRNRRIQVISEALNKS